MRNNKGKDEAKLIDLTVEKCNIETPLTYDLSSSFCSKGEVALETDFVNIIVEVRNQLKKTNNYQNIFSFIRWIEEPRYFWTVYLQES